MWFFELYTPHMVAVITAAIIVVACCIPKKSLTTRELALAASCIALSFALSYIKIKIGAEGGSITLAAIIPLVVYCYFAGLSRGIFAALIYGTLQFLQSAYIQSFAQVATDYLIAFTVFGLVAALKPLREKLRGHDFSIMMVVCYLLRLACHTVIGAVPYPIGFGAGFVGSLAYNAAYILPDLAIALVVLVALIQTKTLQRLEKLYQGSRSN